PVAVLRAGDVDTFAGAASKTLVKGSADLGEGDALADIGGEELGDWRRIEGEHEIEGIRVILIRRLAVAGAVLGPFVAIQARQAAGHDLFELAAKGHGQVDAGEIAPAAVLAGIAFAWGDIAILIVAW